jgi:hypothetical protein
MNAAEAELLADLEPGERAQLEELLTAIWERSGGLEAYAHAAAAEEEAAA